MALNVLRSNLYGFARACVCTSVDMAHCPQSLDVCVSQDVMTHVSSSFDSWPKPLAVHLEVRCTDTGLCEFISKERLFGLGTFATHLLFCLTSFFHVFISPAVGESLLRQICAGFVTVPDKRRSAIHQRFAMPWPHGGHGLVCRAVAEGLGRAAWSGVV